MSRIQKILLSVIGIGVVIQLVSHFSPMALVQWSAQPFAPMISVIFNNDPNYTIFGHTMNRFVPLVVYAIMALWVVNMYRIQDFFANRKKVIMDNTGMSLVEVMVVVAIIAIMGLFAAPMLNTNSYNQRVAANEFLANCQLAKMTAIKGNASVYLGVNNYNYDLWQDGVLIKSVNINGQISIHIASDIEGGELNKRELPKIIPQDVLDACEAEGGALKDCNALAAWAHSYDGTMYLHLTKFTPRGFVTQGDGVYNIIGDSSKYPIRVSMSGNVVIDPKESI